MPKTINYDRIVRLLRHFHSRQGRLPSFSEMQDLLGYRSKGGISVLIPRLSEKGIVHKDETGKLVPGPALKSDLRLLGSIQAGFPTREEEQNLDSISLQDFLVPKPEATFLIKVQGDSMIDAGIMPDDLVLIERGRRPRPGDIVIAEVDGEWTLKYYRKQEGKVFLEAANPRYAPIHPRNRLTIGGVVIANVRKYA